MLPRVFKPEKWTILKELIWNLWIFLSLFFLFAFAAWISMVTNFAQLPVFWTGALALLPIVLFNLVSYNSLLKTKVSRAIDSRMSWFNDDDEKIEQAEKTFVTFESANGKDSFVEQPENIIMIHSSSNYIEIYVREEDEIKMRLLRNSLSVVESLLADYHDIKKCHRCWLVNICQIEPLSNSPKGYSLRVKNGDYKIPVSRRYVSYFRKRLNK
jgi:DNA-binding LytR/AlgR family response regulator